MNPDKTYLGMAEGDFKKRYNNHTKSFRHKRYSKGTQHYLSIFGKLKRSIMKFQL